MMSLTGRPNANVLIVGGGLTGVEAACEIAEAFPGAQVTLASGSPWRQDAAPGGFHRAAIQHLSHTLQRLGVISRAGRVLDCRNGVANIADGSSIAYDLCVWTAGFAPNELAQASGVAVNDHRQVAVDHALRSVSHPHILAIGDLASAQTPASGPCRMGCATALPMGAAAARTVAALLAGHEPPSFEFDYLFRCVSLGRADGLIQFVDFARSTQTPRLDGPEGGDLEGLYLPDDAGDDRRFGHARAARGSAADDAASADALAEAICLTAGALEAGPARPSLRARLLSTYIRSAIKPHSRLGFDVAWARRFLEKPVLRTRITKRIVVEPVRIGAVEGEAVNRAARRRGAHHPLPAWRGILLWLQPQLSGDHLRSGGGRLRSGRRRGLPPRAGASVPGRPRGRRGRGPRIICVRGLSPRPRGLRRQRRRGAGPQPAHAPA